MNICVFEDSEVKHLEPLSLTRPVYDLRTGLQTQLESLSRAFGTVTTYLHSRDYLKEWTASEYDLLVNRIPNGLSILFVNGRLVSDSPIIDELIRVAKAGGERRAFVSGTDLVAVWIPSHDDTFVFTNELSIDNFPGIATEDVGPIQFINRVWDLLDRVPANIVSSFEAAAKGFNLYERPGATIHDGATLLSGESIYVGPGAEIRPGAILDATSGPIYIGSGAKVFENAVIIGPTLVGDHSQVRAGGQLKNVVVGPVCKIGGEVHDSIVHSYSSKVHDGFLGHSYLGRWCNLGAGTNNSNLRNDYGPVSAFNSATGLFESTDRQFLGLIMGDHSKCSIGTMFNTGTTVGVCCNLFNAGFHPRFIPSFTWGSPPERYVEYRLDKAVEVARVVMARRKLQLSDVDVELLTKVHQLTADRRARGIRK